MTAARFILLRMRGVLVMNHDVKKKTKQAALKDAGLMKSRDTRCQH